MAKGKRTNFTHYCPECNDMIGNSTYNKANQKVSELGKSMFCGRCRKHVSSNTKDTKKAN